MDALREQEQEQEKTIEKIVGTPNKKKNILLVEDIKDYADFLIEKLSEKYNIVHAYNLKEARIKAQEMKLSGSLDMVITDLYFPTFPDFKENKLGSKIFYNMPEKNGNKFAQFIKFFYPDTKIIGLSQEDGEFDKKYFDNTINKLELNEKDRYQELLFIPEYQS